MRAQAREWPAGHWGTPVAHDDGKSVEAHLAMKARMGGGRTAITSLAVQVRAATRWPATPGAEQHPWEPPRTARGIANRAKRLKALGNAVVPAVAEAVGYVVVEVLDSLAVRTPKVSDA